MQERSRRIVAIAAGIAVYLGLVLLLYAVGRFALPKGGGLYPLWYTGGELVLKGVIAVVPGFVAGWLSRTRGIGPGAIVGATGGLVEIVLISFMTGGLVDAYAKRIGVTAVATAIGSALTNAAGGSAGRSLRSKLKPQTVETFQTVTETPSRRRRRRRLYAS